MARIRFKWRQISKRNELDLAQFYYWKNKLLNNTRKIAVNKKCPTGFARVVITDSSLVDDDLSFTLLNGCAIVGINGANISLVGAILAQL
jgi:hypothetical protein